ncbi:hypothetical protein C8J56DRAFT_528165 [Mycena floridula]|nr:hypothetical protein C8J56DRAFT_528165 [Mycena floridula]
MRLSVPDESTTNIMPHFSILHLFLLNRRQTKLSISNLPQTLEYLAARKGKSAAIPEDNESHRRAKGKKQKQVNDERRLKKAVKWKEKRKDNGKRPRGKRAQIAVSIAAAEAHKQYRPETREGTGISKGASQVKAKTARLSSSKSFDKESSEKARRHLVSHSMVDELQDNYSQLGRKIQSKSRTYLR